MEVVICNMSRGPDSVLVHRPGCRDIARAEKRGDLNNSWEIEVPDGASLEEIQRLVDKDVNVDLAGDYGITVEEYLARGDGYRSRALPCCTNR